MTMKLFFLTKAILILLLMPNTLKAEPVLSDSGNYTIEEALKIPVATSSSNSARLNLHADIRVPLEAQTNPNKRFPVVIYIPAWASPTTIYNAPANILADNGYIVLTYISRGFLWSDGIIEVASNNDVKDGIAVIDWLIENYPVNTDAIGVSGMSYGAGIALRMVTQDERIRTVVSLSGWANLLESLIPNLTGRADWLLGLVAAGFLTGNPSPEILDNYNNLLNQENIPETIAWVNDRSPILDWDTVNAYKNPPAIYSKNNLNDYLFQPDSMIELIKKHQGPKRFDLDVGTHGSSEILGLLRINTDEIWQNQFAWFDHYLKGEKNGIQCLKPVNWIVDSNYFFSRPKESLNSFDSPVEFNSTTYYLSTNNNSNTGQLQLTPHSQGTQTLAYNTESAEMNSGILIEQVITHPNVDINNININSALVFKGPVLANGVKLRGRIKLSLDVLADNASQYFAYLVEVDPTGNASWISHAPYTVLSQNNSPFIGPQLINIDINMYWTAYDVKPGNYLALIVDSEDYGYLRSPNMPNTSTIVLNNNSQSSLIIPNITQEHPHMTLKNQTSQQLDCADDNPQDLNLGIIEVSNRSLASDRQSSNSVQTTSGSINLLFWLLMLTGFNFSRRQTQASK